MDQRRKAHVMGPKGQADYFNDLAKTADIENIPTKLHEIFAITFLWQGQELS